MIEERKKLEADNEEEFLSCQSNQIPLEFEGESPHHVPMDEDEMCADIP